MSERAHPDRARGAPQPAGGDDIGPVSMLPSGGLPILAIVLGLAVLAIGLFLFLEGRRHRLNEPKVGHVELSQGLGAPMPALVIPAPAPEAAPVMQAPPTPPRIQYIERPGAPPPPIIQYVDRPSPAPPTAAPQGRLNEPALVVDLSDAASAGQAQTSDAAKAVVLHNRSMLVPQGALIPAVLETPIQSSRHGPVRAQTTADVRGFDGARVLIPKGSRLVGDFHSDVESGQSRVLVTWTRLVRPDGIAIRLESPASDPLGGAGIAGDVNNHVLARVSNAVLQTALTVGVNLASRPGAGSVIISEPAQAVTSNVQTLSTPADLKPTITVREGAEITVFVTKDLDFSGTLPRP